MRTKPNNKLFNKVVLITGGSSGIGYACAEAFAKMGLKVVISGRNMNTGLKAQQKLAKLNQYVVFLQADITDSKSVQNLFNQILNQYGRLDYAVNNAGIEGSSFVKTADYEESTWDNVININLKGTWLCLKSEIKQMLIQETKGAIVNIASYAGIMASKTGGVAYTASKHGVVGMTKSAAIEYAINNIRVNAVCPGVIWTSNARQVIKKHNLTKDQIEKMHPMSRVGIASDVADAVVWLCLYASFVTGDILCVDGGLHL